MSVVVGVIVAAFAASATAQQAPATRAQAEAAIDSGASGGLGLAPAVKANISGNSAAAATPGSGPTRVGAGGSSEVMMDA